MGHYLLLNTYTDILMHTLYVILYIKRPKDLFLQIVYILFSSTFPVLSFSIKVKGEIIEFTHISVAHPT